MNHSLINTEKRLTTLFVGGAFIFLVLFEGFFLLGRFVFEERFSRENFRNEIERIESRSRGEEIGRRGGGPKFGMTTLQISNSGDIIGGQIGFGPLGVDVSEIDTRILVELPEREIKKSDGMIYYKKPLSGEASGYMVFMRTSGYPLEDILRDILRFLALDIIILLPFYFLGRFFVRETLKPVRENMDAMSHFIHDSGHEMKTPLAIVSGNLQILRDEKGKDIHLIEASIETIENMSRSLDGLIELSNLKKPEKLPPLSLLTQVQSLVVLHHDEAVAKNIEVHIDIPPKAKVMIDPNHFSILFSNLYKNAITYNKDGGSISVDYTENTLSIKDTGIGMSKDDQRKIFDRFFRVDRSGKYPGTGIGLSLVERIIKIYDWKIRIDSTPDEGTTIKVHTK